MSTDRLEHCKLKFTSEENSYIWEKANLLGCKSRQEYLLNFLSLHDPDFPKETRNRGEWNKGKTGKLGFILSDKQCEYKQLCWEIANEFLGSDDCLLIANLRWYSLALSQKERNSDFLKFFIQYGKDKEDFFAGVKWILEFVLTISHKTNPFIIFKNIRIDRLVEEND